MSPFVTDILISAADKRFIFMKTSAAEAEIGVLFCVLKGNIRHNLPRTPYFTAVLQQLMDHNIRMFNGPYP